MMVNFLDIIIKEVNWETEGNKNKYSWVLVHGGWLLQTGKMYSALPSNNYLHKSFSWSWKFKLVENGHIMFPSLEYKQKMPERSKDQAESAKRDIWRFIPGSFRTSDLWKKWLVYTDQKHYNTVDKNILLNIKRRKKKIHPYVTSKLGSISVRIGKYTRWMIFFSEDFFNLH